MFWPFSAMGVYYFVYRSADKSLSRPGRKQANVSVRMAWISFDALPCRKRNLMTARVSILLKSRPSQTCFRACFLPGRTKDLSAHGNHIAVVAVYIVTWLITLFILGHHLSLFWARRIFGAFLSPIFIGCLNVNLPNLGSLCLWSALISSEWP